MVKKIPKNPEEIDKILEEEYDYTDEDMVFVKLTDADRQAELIQAMRDRILKGDYIKGS